MTSPTDDTLADPQFATTLARGLEILRCFTPEEPMLGNKELAAKTGLSKPTISRFTYTLVRLGYLRVFPATNKYKLGSAVVSLGYPLLACMPIRQVARPAMNELANLVGGSVSMGIRDRLNIVYVETSRSDDILAPQFSDLGRTHPIAGSSIGAAYLCACPPAEREALINEIKVKTPEQWERHGKAVLRNIKNFPELGFCVSGDVGKAEVVGVGVPLRRLVEGELIVFNCAINVASSKKLKLETEVGPRLKALVRTLEFSMRSY